MPFRNTSRTHLLLLFFRKTASVVLQRNLAEKTSMNFFGQAISKGRDTITKTKNGFHEQGTRPAAPGERCSLSRWRNGGEKLRSTKVAEVSNSRVWVRDDAVHAGQLFHGRRADLIKNRKDSKEFASPAGCGKFHQIHVSIVLQLLPFIIFNAPDFLLIERAAGEPRLLRGPSTGYGSPRAWSTPRPRAGRRP